MNFLKLFLYISTVSAAVVTATLSASDPAVTKTTSVSSSKRAQILPTGTPPMFASAKNAIISNVRSLRVPTASGYLARDVQPTQGTVPSTLSHSSNTAANNATSSAFVAQTNSVSRVELSVALLILSVLLAACSAL